MNTLLLLGSLNMFIAVALGAFGAHALKKKLSEDMMKVYQTGIQYHIAHALGLLLLGQNAGSDVGSSLVITAGWFLLAGIILFSGSLYALSLTGVRKLGAITPLGGIAFLAGWIIFMVAIAQG
ncbi:MULTISPECIES: DUF423 domain-containing protein [unclassified Paenibacillus]|uniref:DUF423 domain-containing protein n=1 Tax=unclassified Paenibacillus TaxID=185978 RepID=UPI001AE47BE0|nr:MULTISPECIES: DUF423 domain-containing protein [unclassified Paenibacillus]MBP1155746.1 uncharacterized membrane protein YgdD (TMEM256/DUF423 family) [Paenibacillus sp. PvP091]MBP1168868.1 uncharacterized membrane protein YgdD (TMEM256/DUF423 family) [Paenibacillus sp. PvR098]MBP2439896.1 uncharacterized membrane protein YgdD (TMEM256/DUF423 family) [Paenibacillus sp. PvP052]